MPAFTFEKISSPVRSTTSPVPINAQAGSSEQTSKPRGVIFQMLDRLVVARIKREQRDADTIAPHKHPPPD